jgi:[glutamine synthetase] adenylyltransferase / [glutamine synthetase]-adenylyl-L-tyrosine phosphorylase
VQYLVLAHAHQHPALTANDGNIALLGVAAKLGFIAKDAAASVGDAYRDFRRLQHKLRLNGAKYARVPGDAVEQQTRATRALWRAVFGAD